MVRAQAAAAHPQTNTGRAAQADRAGYAGGVYAMVAALAAGGAALAAERRVGSAGGAAPARRLRSAGHRMGADPPAPTRRGVRSAMAGCSVPGGGGGLGT